MVYFCFFKLCDISCKENREPPSCVSPVMLSWELVVAYACVGAGVFMLKWSAVTAKILNMKYKSVSKCLILQLNSSSTPHISFWTVLQQSHCTVLSYEVIFKSFVFFLCKVAYRFPRMLPDTLHLCFLSLLWWCIFTSVSEFKNVDLIRFPVEKK